jgi:hypothetical protein
MIANLCRNLGSFIPSLSFHFFFDAPLPLLTTAFSMLSEQIPSTSSINSYIFGQFASIAFGKDISPKVLEALANCHFIPSLLHLLQSVDKRNPSFQTIWHFLDRVYLRSSSPVLINLEILTAFASFQPTYSNKKFEVNFILKCIFNIVRTLVESPSPERRQWLAESGLLTSLLSQRTRIEAMKSVLHITDAYVKSNADFIDDFVTCGLLDTLVYLLKAPRFKKIPLERVLSTFQSVVELDSKYLQMVVAMKIPGDVRAVVLNGLVDEQEQGCTPLFPAFSLLIS